MRKDANRERGNRKEERQTDDEKGKEDEERERGDALRLISST